MSLALLVMGCGERAPSYYQGYAEAEYVRVALPFAGSLERLNVQRGMQVKAGDELFVLGLGLGCGSPLSMILAYNRAPAGRSGEAIGLRQTVNKATEVVMPVIFGSLSTAVGMLPVFWMEALILAWAGSLMRKEAGRKDESESVKVEG